MIKVEEKVWTEADIKEEHSYCHPGIPLSGGRNKKKIECLYMSPVENESNSYATFAKTVKIKNAIPLKKTYPEIPVEEPPSESEVKVEADIDELRNDEQNQVNRQLVLNHHKAKEYNHNSYTTFVVKTTKINSKIPEGEPPAERVVKGEADEDVIGNDDQIQIKGLFRNIHHKAKTYCHRCDECKARFRTQVGLQFHKCTSHNKKQNDNTTVANTIEEDNKVHNGDPPSECVVKVEADIDHFRSYNQILASKLFLKNSHLGKTYDHKCDECNASYFEIAGGLHLHKLAYHRLTHKKESNQCNA